jgi:hypothetical protein
MLADQRRELRTTLRAETVLRVSVPRLGWLGPRRLQGIRLVIGLSPLAAPRPQRGKSAHTDLSLLIRFLLPRLADEVKDGKGLLGIFKEYSLASCRRSALLVATLTLGGVALADDGDPAGRVARLGYVQGQVSIEPAGLDDWAGADLNRPLTSGDKLWSDAASRAELSIGSAVVRLASMTGFSFLNLDDHTAQMQVTAGTVSIHVRSMSDTLEVDTPNVAISLLGPGDYRVEVNDTGDATVVKVSGGTAEVTGGGQDFPVHPQQAVTFSGNSNLADAVTSLGAPDAFDSWAYDRDRQAQAAQASSYVSPDVIGEEDLDQNGTWQPTPDDGYVWAPNTVVVGWAPYRFGHWLWISPWGWTWVDDARWGFAPFHYGRWATFGGRWCWVPGPSRAHPVYAPALVAWVGGARLGESVGFGGGVGVAWFPLGPREVYVPAYPASQSYVRNINSANTNVTSAYITSVYNNTANNHYINRNAPGAVTAVSQSAFTSAQPVGRNALRIPPNEIASAAISTTAPAITPDEQSVLGAGASAALVRKPPRAIQNRLVLAKAVPPASPVPLAFQLRAIRANGGRPLARSELASLQMLAPAAPVRMTTREPGDEMRSGMDRAARPPREMRATTVPLIRSTEPRTAIARPPMAAPAAPIRPIESPQQRELSQSDTQTLRADRPPTPAGQPAMEDRARTIVVPQPEKRASADGDANRRVDRALAAPVYIPAPAPLAPAVTTEAIAVPTPKVAKPPAHAQTPARPAERGREN